MTLNIYNCLIIAGIIQGFIFSIVVFSNQKLKQNSNRLLGLLVLAYSLGNLQYIIPDVGLMDLVTMYKFIYLPLAPLIPVLIFMYVNHFLIPDKTYSRLELMLLIPFGLFLLITLVFRFMFIVDAGDGYAFRLFGQIVILIEIFSVLLAAILVPIQLWKVVQAGRNAGNFDPKVINSSLKWLQYTLVIILIGTLLWGYLTYQNVFVPDSNVSYYPLWIIIAITIYWLGHIGIYKFGIIQQRKQIRAYNGNKNNMVENTAAQNSHVVALQNLMVEKKAFLDPGLTLEHVAHQLDLSTSYLSRVIKSELHTNYSDYINEFRVAEAKNYLGNPDFSTYTITAIGLEAGFNSKSSFYEVFKKHTGQTPLHYKRTHARNFA